MSQTLRTDSSPRRFASIRTQAILATLSLLITAASAYIVRLQETPVGNLCEKTAQNPDGLCFDFLPVAGYPVPFWKDIGGISVEGKLGPEDDFFAAFFIADWAIWYLVLAVLFLVYSRLKRLRQRSV